jgi:hypothetical protein
MTSAEIREERKKWLAKHPELLEAAETLAFVFEVLHALHPFLPGFSLAGQAVVLAIGDGMVLRIPKPGIADPNDRAGLVEGYPELYRRAAVPVPKFVVDELLASNYLRLMARDDKDQLGGWKSAGLDGEIADFYCAAI